MQSSGFQNSSSECRTWLPATRNVVLSVPSTTECLSWIEYRSQALQLVLEAVGFVQSGLRQDRCSPWPSVGQVLQDQRPVLVQQRKNLYFFQAV